MAFNLTAQLSVALNTASLKNAANTINSQLKDVGAVSLGIPKNDADNLRYIKVQAAEASTAMEQFGRQSGLAAKRFVAFTLTAGAIITFTSSLKQALTAAVDFDREMIRLTQVSTDSVGQVGAVGNEVTRLSKNYGVSSKDLLTTAVTLKQANLSLADTKVALEALAQAALAPSFDNLRDTTEGAIAVMNQFGISAKDLGNALGSINAVAAEFAVEAQDLIEGVRKAGGAFKAAGGDLNEFLALFTSIRQTTRESAESIGTGLRTIFTRVQRNETVEALKDIGVQLRYTAEEAKAAGDLGLANQFVGPYEAVKRLSGALNELRSTDPRFSAIIEELGGYRQISKVIPLIQEFGVAQKALGVAQIGGASLALNAAQAQEAFGVKIQKVKEEFADFIRNLTNTSSFKSLIDLLLGAASAGIALADSLKGVLPVITAIAAVKTVQSLTGFAKGFGSTAFSPAPANQPSTFSPFLPTGGKKASGGIIKMAKGGVVPGVGRGDKVPALLEPGELVIPRSRFAPGGTVLDTIKKTGKIALHDLYDTEAVKDNIEIVGEINRVQLGNYDKYREDSERILNAGKNAYQKEIDKSNNVKTATTRANSAVSKAFGKPTVGGRKGFVPTLGEKYFQVPIGEGHNSQYNQIAGGLGEADTAMKIRRGGSNTSYQRLGNEQGLDFRDGKNLIETKVTKKQVPDKEIIAKALLYQASIAKTTYKQGKAETIFLNNLSVYESFKKPPTPMAIGGIVPGVGNTDSVPLDLPIGSYVVRKSSVAQMGASNLSRLGRASGGVIPSLVMPGEYIYTPDETKKIGVSNLNHINKTGRQKFGTGRFVGYDSMGVEVRDTVDAATEAEAIAKIRQMGYFVTEFKWIESKKKRGSKTVEPPEPDREDPYKDLKKRDRKLAKQIEGQFRIPTNLEGQIENEEQAKEKVKEIRASGKRVKELKKTRTSAAGDVERGLKKEESLTNTRAGFIKDLDERQGILTKAKNEDEEARRIQKKHYDAAANYNRKAEVLATQKLGAEASGDFAKSNSIQKRIDALKQKEERATARAVKKQETVDATTETRLLAEENITKTRKNIETIDKSIETNSKNIEANRKKEATAAKQERKERKRFDTDKDGNVIERGKVITSTYGDGYKKEVQKELDNYKKVYGEEATGGSRKAVRESVSQRMKAGYFNQIKSFSEARGLEFNEDFANKQAQQMARETAAGRRKFEVSDKGEFYDPTLANRLKKEGYSETGKKGLVRKGSDFLKNTFSRDNLQNNIFAASTGLGMIGGSFDLSDAKAKEAVANKNEGSYKAGAATSGALTGAAAGAAVGSFLGPLGIAAGFVIGGLTGLSTGLRDAAKQIADIKLEQAGTQLKNAFAVAATSFNKISATNLKEVTDLQDKIDASIDEKVKSSSSFFSFTSRAEQQATSGKAERRTQYAGQASGINSLLSKQIEEEIKPTITLDVKTNTFKAQDDQKFDLNKFFEDSANSSQLAKLSIGLDQPIEKLKKQFETFAKDFEKQQISIKNQTLAIKSTEQLNIAFSLLANASSNAASTLNNLSPAFQTITDALSSNFSIGQKRKISTDVQSSFLNPSAFAENLKDVSSGLGSSGANFQKSGNIVANISSLLPDILANINPNDIKGGKDPQTVLRGVLTQELKNRGFDPSQTIAYVNSIVGKMGEDFNKMLNESGGDYGEFAKKIMSGVSEPFLKAYQNIAADLEKASDAYVSGINKLAQETLKTVQEFDKLSKIQQQTRTFSKNIDIEKEINKQKKANPLGARFGEIKEGQIGLDMTNISDQTKAFAEQQARLTGLNNGNQLDPQQIQDRINQNRINTEAAEAKRKNARFTAGANGRGQDTDATNELGRLKVEASLLNQAMRNLADSTEEVSAIEQRVGKIRQEIANEEQENARKQSDTETRGETLLKASPEQLQRLQAGSQLTNIAKELGGNLLRFNVEQRKAIFEYLDFSGDEGKKLKSEFLQASGFVSKPETKAQDKYGPQLLQLNAQLFAVMAVREQAQLLIIQDQQTLQGQFFAQLTLQNEQFFTRLSAELSRTQIAQQEQSIRTNDAKIKDLQSIAPSAKGMANFVTQESYTKYVAPNSKDITTFLSSVEKQKSLEAKATDFAKTKDEQGNYQANVIAANSVNQDDSLNVGRLLNQLAQNKNLAGLDINAIAAKVQSYGDASGKFKPGRLVQAIDYAVEQQFIPMQSKEVQTQVGLSDKLGLIRRGDKNGFSFENNPNAQGDQINLGSFVKDLLQQNVTSSVFSKAVDDIQRLGGFIGSAFLQQIRDLQAQSNIAADTVQNLNVQLNLLNAPRNLVAPVNPVAPPVLRRSTGGMVTHASAMVGADPTVFKPIGPDTIPAMLNHGEYVVNAKATSENLPLLQALNGGGTVKPTKAMNDGGAVKYLADGAFVDPAAAAIRAPLSVNRIEAQRIAKMQRQQNVDIAVLTKFGNLRGSWRRNALNNSLRIMQGDDNLTNIPYQDGSLPISAVVSKQNIAPWSMIRNISDTGLNIQNLNPQKLDKINSMAISGQIYAMPLAIKQVPYQQILDATEDYLRANRNAMLLGVQAIDPVDNDGNSRAYYERRANLKPYFEDLLMAGSPPDITTIGGGYFERVYGLKDVKNIKVMGFSKGGQADRKTPAMVQSGEFIIGADKAKKNKGLLDYMNSGGKVSYLNLGGEPDDFIRNSFNPGVEKLKRTLRHTGELKFLLEPQREDPSLPELSFKDKTAKYLGERKSNQFQRYLEYQKRLEELSRLADSQIVGSPNNEEKIKIKNLLNEPQNIRLGSEIELFPRMYNRGFKENKTGTGASGSYSPLDNVAATFPGPDPIENIAVAKHERFHAVTNNSQSSKSPLNNSIFGSLNTDKYLDLTDKGKTTFAYEASAVYGMGSNPEDKLKRLTEFSSSLKEAKNYQSEAHKNIALSIRDGEPLPVSGILEYAGQGKEMDLLNEAQRRASEYQPKTSSIAPSPANKPLSEDFFKNPELLNEYQLAVDSYRASYEQEKLQEFLKNTFNPGYPALKEALQNTGTLRFKEPKAGDPTPFMDKYEKNNVDFDPMVSQKAFLTKQNYDPYENRNFFLAESEKYLGTKKAKRFERYLNLQDRLADANLIEELEVQNRRKIRGPLQGPPLKGDTGPKETILTTFETGYQEVQNNQYSEDIIKLEKRLSEQPSNKRIANAIAGFKDKVISQQTQINTFGDANEFPNLATTYSRRSNSRTGEVETGFHEFGHRVSSAAQNPLSPIHNSLFGAIDMSRYGQGYGVDTMLAELQSNYLERGFSANPKLINGKAPAPGDTLKRPPSTSTLSVLDHAKDFGLAETYNSSYHRDVASAIKNKKPIELNSIFGKPEFANKGYEQALLEEFIMRTYPNDPEIGKNKIAELDMFGPQPKAKISQLYEPWTKEAIARTAQEKFQFEPKPKSKAGLGKAFLKMTGLAGLGALLSAGNANADINLGRTPEPTKEIDAGQATTYTGTALLAAAGVGVAGTLAYQKLRGKKTGALGIGLGIASSLFGGNVNAADEEKPIGKNTPEPTKEIDAGQLTTYIVAGAVGVGLGGLGLLGLQKGYNSLFGKKKDGEVGVEDPKKSVVIEDPKKIVGDAPKKAGFFEKINKMIGGGVDITNIPGEMKEALQGKNTLTPSEEIETATLNKKQLEKYTSLDADGRNNFLIERGIRQKPPETIDPSAKIKEILSSLTRPEQILYDDLSKVEQDNFIKNRLNTQKVVPTVSASPQGTTKDGLADFKTRLDNIVELSKGKKPGDKTVDNAIYDEIANMYKRSINPTKIPAEKDAPLLKSIIGSTIGENPKFSDPLNAFDKYIEINPELSKLKSVNDIRSIIRTKTVKESSTLSERIKAFAKDEGGYLDLDRMQEVAKQVKRWVSNASKIKQVSAGKTSSAAHRFSNIANLAEMGLPFLVDPITDFFNDPSSNYGIQDIGRSLGEAATGASESLPMIAAIMAASSASPLLAAGVGITFLGDTSNALQDLGDAFSTSKSSAKKQQKVISKYSGVFPGVQELFDKQAVDGPDIDLRDSFGQQPDLLNSFKGKADTTLTGDAANVLGTTLAGAGSLAGFGLPGIAIGATAGLLIASYKIYQNAQATSLKKEKMQKARDIRNDLQGRYNKRGQGNFSSDFFDKYDNKDYVEYALNKPQTYFNNFSDEIESYGIYSDPDFKNLKSNKYLNQYPFSAVPDAVLAEKLESDKKGSIEAFMSEISELQKGTADQKSLQAVRDRYSANYSTAFLDGKTKNESVLDSDKADVFSKLFINKDTNVSSLKDKILNDRKNESRIAEIASRLGIVPEKELSEYDFGILKEKYEIENEKINLNEADNRTRINEKLGMLEQEKIVQILKSLKVENGFVQKYRSPEYINTKSNEISKLKNEYDLIGKKFEIPPSYKELSNTSTTQDINKNKNENENQEYIKKLKEEMETDLFGGVYKERTTVEDLKSYIDLMIVANKELFYQDSNNGFSNAEGRPISNYEGIIPQRIKNTNRIDFKNINKSLASSGRNKEIVQAFYGNKLFDNKDQDILSYINKGFEGDVLDETDFYNFDGNKIRKELNLKNSSELSSKDILEYFSKNKDIGYSWNGQKQPIAMASGGIVPSSAPNPDPSFFKAKGSDTVPAILSPGEYVVNARATSANLPLLQNLNSGGAVRYLYRGGNLTAINPFYAAYSGQSPGRGYISSGPRYDNLMDQRADQGTGLYDPVSGGRYRPTRYEKQRTDFDIGTEGYLASRVFNPRVNANTLGNLANYAADRTGSLNKPGYGRYTFNTSIGQKHLKEFGSTANYGNISFGGGPIPNYVGGLNALSDSPYGSAKMAGASKFAMEDAVFNDILNNKEISRAPITGYRTSAVGSRYMSGLIGGPPNHGDNGQNYDKVSLKDYINELGFSKAGNQSFQGVSANKALAGSSLASMPGSNVGIAQQAISKLQNEGLGRLSVNNTDVAATKALDTIKNARISQANEPYQQISPPKPAPNPYYQLANVQRNRAQGNSVFGFANGGSSTDTQPAMLTPGEFVVSRPAVDRVGTAFLNRVNNYAKGGPVGYFAGGSGEDRGPIATFSLKQLGNATLNLDSTAGRVESGANTLGKTLEVVSGSFNSASSTFSQAISIMNTAASAMNNASRNFQVAVNDLTSALDRIPKTITLAIAPLSLNVSFNTPSVLLAIQQSLSGITLNVAAMIASAIRANKNDNFA